MLNLLNHIVVVLLPLVLTSSLHMVVVKRNFLAAFNIPLWNYGFGTNKTWRGVIFVPMVNACLVWIIAQIKPIDSLNPLALGYMLGIAYLLSELPNSFLKRRLGIGSGISGTRFKYLFYILDKTDSSFGVTLCYALLTHISFEMALSLFICNSLVHTIVAFILIKLKIKKGF